jgi:1-phosphatidylinositol-4-phosphate 5-kinase
MGIINDDYYQCFKKNSTDSFYTQDSKYINCDALIGYSYNSAVPISFLVIAIIGLVLNFLLIKDFIIKSNNSSRRQSSMKKLFAALPVLDCITSIYWIVSSVAFRKVQNICDHKNLCAFLSIIYFSVFIFEFIFINFILIHFRKISLNPIEGILKPGKNIKIYLSISIIATLLILGNITGIKIIGRSPMNTCFINTEQSGPKGLIFLIPITSTFCVIFQVIYDLKCRQLFINDKEVREAYKINSMYILVFSLLHIPMFLLIIITSAKKIGILANEKVLINYTYFSTLVTCSIPMIVGIIRNCKGFTKIKKIREIQRRFTQTMFRQKTINEINRKFSKPLTDNCTPEDQFDWLEKHAMEFFMRDILLSIAHCIYTGKSYGRNIYLQNLDKENESYIKHNIAFDNFKLNDPSVTQSEYLDVTVIEYAPKIFAYLRNLENINIDEMAESFLPKNNKQGISESQGKSGSFFISTDDNQYMIKTLRVDEFDLIRKTFLNTYVSYVTKNTSSLLCRIYGMYTITMSQGEEILVIVMRNVIGEFKNNIIAKYDLKGSSANRISDFDMERSDSSTMKDLNFNEFEHGIMISRENIKRFRKLTRLDSCFLSSMDLMDYSLFLVKLTLDKEQAADIFGDKIREKQDSAFSELMVENSIKPSMSIMSNGASLQISSVLDNLNVDELKPRKTLQEKGEIFHNIKYYKQYLFPSLMPGVAYICAIIDYFQMFNFYKYVESGLKTKFGQKKDKVSCVDPKTYSKRFIKYFETLTEIKHMLKDGQKTDQSNFRGRSTNNFDSEEEDEKEAINEDVSSEIEMTFQPQE